MQGFGPRAPSPWVRRFAALVPIGSAVLDLACGRGRHARLFLERGHPVTCVDRDVAQLGELAFTPGLEAIEADLEDGSPWPLGERCFAGIVVTNYLWRPLFPRILEAVAPGGVLIYATFALGNESLGRPARPEFLLRPGELLEVVRGKLTVIAYEHGRVERPRPAVRQRLCAIASTRPAALPEPQHDPIC